MIRLPTLELKKEFEIVQNSIICGDAITVMKEMPNNCVNLVITSPPYDNLRDYNGYCFDFEVMANALYRVIIEGGVLVWVIGDKINGGRSLTSFRQGIYFQEIRI